MFKSVWEAIMGSDRADLLKSIDAMARTAKLPYQDIDMKARVYGKSFTEEFNEGIREMNESTTVHSAEPSTFTAAHVKAAVADAALPYVKAEWDATMKSMKVLLAHPRCKYRIVAEPDKGTFVVQTWKVEEFGWAELEKHMRASTYHHTAMSRHGFLHGDEPVSMSERLVAYAKELGHPTLVITWKEHLGARRFPSIEAALLALRMFLVPGAGITEVNDKGESVSNG